MTLSLQRPCGSWRAQKSKIDMHAFVSMNETTWFGFEVMYEYDHGPRLLVRKSAEMEGMQSIFWHTKSEREMMGFENSKMAVTLREPRELELLTYSR